MRKIIAAFDGFKYSQSTRDYALELAKKTQAHLVGLFLDDFTYTSYKIYELIVKEGASQSKLKKFEANDKALRDTSVADFEKICRHEGVTFSLHRDRSIAIQELLRESVYADLVILDSKETLTLNVEGLPTRFVQDFLSGAQCPVLLVPEKHHPIKKIVLLYDGEPSSVHAIKMFSYTLPEFKDLETELISVNPPDTDLHLEEKKLIKEFLKRHYPNAKYTVRKGFAEMEIEEVLKKQKNNTMVVLGAYRRGNLSRWFRESMADKLMKDLKLPLFIAHYK